jgi:hypothetical protein
LNLRVLQLECGRIFASSFANFGADEIFPFLFLQSFLLRHGRGTRSHRRFEQRQFPIFVGEVSSAYGTDLIMDVDDLRTDGRSDKPRGVDNPDASHQTRLAFTSIDGGFEHHIEFAISASRVR